MLGQEVVLMMRFEIGFRNFVWIWEMATQACWGSCKAVILGERGSRLQGLLSPTCLGRTCCLTGSGWVRPDGKECIYGTSVCTTLAF